jgi:hypothetical protein
MPQLASRIVVEFSVKTPVAPGAYLEFSTWKKSLYPGSVPGIGFDVAIWAANLPDNRRRPDAW